LPRCSALRALGVRIRIDIWHRLFQPEYQKFPFRKITSDQSFRVATSVPIPTPCDRSFRSSSRHGFSVSRSRRGVETEAALSCLRSGAVSEGQGFCFSAPSQCRDHLLLQAQRGAIFVAPPILPTSPRWSPESYFLARRLRGPDRFVACCLRVAAAFFAEARSRRGRRLAEALPPRRAPPTCRRVSRTRWCRNSAAPSLVARRRSPFYRRPCRARSASFLPTPLCSLPPRCARVRVVSACRYSCLSPRGIVVSFWWCGCQTSQRSSHVRVSGFSGGNIARG